MALSIPIISEFDGKGIDRAIREFKQLETAGEKAHFLIKKAAIPAAAALAGVTAALTLATKAAMEDELEQAKLAQTLEKTTGATDAQIKATEDMIAAMSRATGTADSELRPAFAALVLGSHDVASATDALAIAQDVATSTGKSLAEVSQAMSLGFGGNMKALAALSPELKGMIKEGATLDTVMSILSDNFGGSTAKAADTAAGKFKILKNSMAEFTESVGALLLPVVERVLPVLQRMSDWAQANPKAFLAVAASIVAVSVAILAMNIAINANPFVALGSALLTVSTYLIYAYTKFETFRNIVNGVFNAIMVTMEVFVNAFNRVINSIIYAYNLINFGADVPSIPTLTLPRAGGGGGSSVSSGAASVGSGMAREGGTQNIVTPLMPALTSPVKGGGGSGGGGSGGGGGGASAPLGVQGLGGAQVGALTTFGNAERIAARGDTITVNVNGGISTGPQIGQAVYNALLNYKQVYGPLDALAV